MKRAAPKKKKKKPKTAPQPAEQSPPQAAADYEAELEALQRKALRHWLVTYVAQKAVAAQEAATSTRENAAKHADRLIKQAQQQAKQCVRDATKQLEARQEAWAAQQQQEEAAHQARLAADRRDARLSQQWCKLAEDSVPLEAQQQRDARRESLHTAKRLAVALLAKRRAEFRARLERPSPIPTGTVTDARAGERPERVCASVAWNAGLIRLLRHRPDAKLWEQPAAVLQHHTVLAVQQRLLHRGPCRSMQAALPMHVVYY